MTKLLLIASVSAAAVLAQSGTTPAFSYRAAAATAPSTVANNGTIQFGNAPAGQTATMAFSILNTTGEAWTLTRVSTSGTNFKDTSQAPVTIRTGESHSFDLTYLPTTKGLATGMLSLELRSAGDRSCVCVFTLAATATAPDLIFSYLPSGGNQTALGDGEAIAFSNSAVGQTLTATFFINNRGNAAATVTRVQAGGSDAFRVTGLPLLPSDIAPDREIRFNIAFTPLTRDPMAGFIRVETSAGSRTFVLQGQGRSAELSYALRYDATVQPVAVNGPIRVPDAPVGNPVVSVLTIRNEGTAEARIAALSISGTGFAFGDLPALPSTLTPGAAIDIPIVFNPKEAGPMAGRLRIDSVTFDLSGTGVGPKLTLAASLPSGTLVFTPSTVLTFPNTRLGGISEAVIAMENAGNKEATVSGISVSGGAFRLEDLPALPARIPPGESRSFRLRFTPDAIDAITATLLIDDMRFSLRGTGAQPEAVGDVVIRVAGDTVNPLQQPSVGLSLSKPSPIPLTGRLTLSFNSDSFSDDRTIQFATGGRTVDFRIPADSTEAIFGDSARQIFFQAGTVAGQILLTATLQYGNVNLTPQPAPSRQIAMTRREPGLRSVAIVPKSATAFDLVISGYSTPRSVRRMMLQFTPAAGKQLATTSLTADVESAFAAWYASTASASFGSQFSVTLTIGVSSGDMSAIQSVNVSAVNEHGNSNTITANLR
jgi:hypothetical protein